MPITARILLAGREAVLGRCLLIRSALRRGMRTVHAVEPEFWQRLDAELRAGRQWLDRAIVLTYAVVTGLVVVGFTLLAEAASHGFEQLHQAGPLGPWLTLFWTPALTVAVLWWTRRLAPGAMGSGIPQVMRALADDASTPSWLVSLRLAVHKIGLVSGGLLAGLSIGREGPTVQVGAGVMVHAQRWLSPQSGLDAHRKLTLQVDRLNLTGSFGATRSISRM
ncbi:voltage-gated chloride channel [Sphaerotilus hippei]|uniref:Voltage-gated chloride channel n=1 Tax=Sphaerotilus hippei TaxID=744406 RepID=A0A318GYT7_9BURK|nr:chloride channel protein [Sphaerotilus hippei]PXW95173.1 voltage-gated chloride channel [Sphaerotilus hippei]